MLKIERDCDGCVTSLRLSGRIQAGDIPDVQSAIGGGCARKVLDLSEVTFVDLGVVQFLISCEEDGIELVQCPPYVREWILRERAQRVQPERSDGG
jgi:anti-anti-sigma regulatory factor